MGRLRLLPESVVKPSEQDRTANTMALQLQDDEQQNNTQSISLANNSLNSSTHIPHQATSTPSSTLISEIAPAGLAVRNVALSSAAAHNVDTPTDGLQCCCGRLDCAYLRHNNAALGDLESNLETAARLGQVSSTLLQFTFFYFLGGA
jgi:hypothetical protein